jgi:hypothetical protein
VFPDAFSGRAVHLMMNQQGEQISNAGKQLSNKSDIDALLVASQRKTKNELKTKLKFQRRVHKLETRIANSISSRTPGSQGS